METIVLLVDDEPEALSSLRRLLRTEAYELHCASSGEEALDKLRTLDASVIVCDQRMPGMPGSDVLAEARVLRPDATRVVLTGYTDITSAVRTVNDGAIHYFMVKPWEDEQFVGVLRQAVQRFKLRRSLTEARLTVQQQRDQLETLNRSLLDKVHEQTAHVRVAYEQTLEALVAALDVRERAASGHSWRVAAYALHLAVELGIEEERLPDLFRGAVLHDIGKIGIPDTVLLKPGLLDDRERAIIETHVAIGVELLSRVEHLAGALTIPKYHHEKFDGTGYAEGLRGEAIPLEARVFAVADVYDALRSNRPYKAAMDHADAAAIIDRESASHFDPQVVRAFRAITEVELCRLASFAARARGFDATLEACQSVRPLRNRRAG